MPARTGRPLFLTLGGSLLLAAAVVLAFMGTIMILMDNAYVYGESDVDEGLIGWSLVGAAALLVIARVAWVLRANHRMGVHTFSRGSVAGVVAVATGFVVFGLASWAVGAITDSWFAVVCGSTAAAAGSGVFVHTKLSRTQRGA